MKRIKEDQQNEEENRNAERSCRGAATASYDTNCRSADLVGRFLFFSLTEN